MYISEFENTQALFYVLFENKKRDFLRFSKLLQRGGAFLRLLIASALLRAARSGLWVSATTAEELVDDADLMNDCFFKVRHCAHHILEELLPPTSDSQRNLRKRRHNITLPEKKRHNC